LFQVKLLEKNEAAIAKAQLRCDDSMEEEMKQN
jgi:hypothetical protein